jgi:hypothetical protein
MIQRLLSSLRRELSPLVEAKLREELAPKVRAEIENETRELANLQLERELHQRAEAARAEIEKGINVQVTHIDKTLEMLAWKAKASFESVFDTAAQTAFRERVITEINQLVAIRIETLREEMTVAIRAELEPGIREEITARVRSEREQRLAQEVELEKVRLTRAFREGLLLEHVRSRDIDAVRSLVARQLKPEVEAGLKTTLRDEAFNRLLTELRDGVEQQHAARLTSELRSKLESEMVPQVRAELSRKLELGIRNELIAKLTPRVEAQLAQQLRMPLLISMGAIDATVAGVLRKNMSGMSAELRELILDEIWAKVTGAILGAFAAASELKEEEWESYLEKARELIDDRIQGTFRAKRRKLRDPDGFYRAIEDRVCSRTGEAILPGDYYLVIRGRPIGLPLVESLAEELVEDQGEGDADTDADEIEPPYDGVPWIDDDDDSDNGVSWTEEAGNSTEKADNLGRTVDYDQI